MRRINPGLVSLFDGGVVIAQSSGTSGNPPGRTSAPSVGSDSGNEGNGVAYFVDSARAEIWQSAALYQSSGEIPGTSGRAVFRLWNGSQYRWELRYHTDGAGRLQLYKNNVLQATSTATYPFTSGVHKHFEWHVLHAASGTVEVWINGAQDTTLTISGDTKNGQNDPIQFDYGTLNDTLGRSMYLSDCILTDEGRIKNAGLKILYPNASGDLNQWSGSYTDIDDAPISASQNDGDTTYSAATSTALKRLQNIDNLSINATIISFSEATVMRQFIAGSPAFQHKALLRKLGVDYEQSGTPNNQLLYTSPAQVVTWTTDPGGGVWTKSKINGSLQIGSVS